MKQKALLVLASLVAACVLILSSVLTAGGVVRAKQVSQAPAQVAAPAVANAAAARKYKGQTITFFGGSSVGVGNQQAKMLAAKFSQATGVKVKVIPEPTASDQTYQQIARTLSSHSSSYDVMMIDVVWPGAFAPYLVDLKPALGSLASQDFSTIVQNNTVDGHLVALPWYGDFGILYYRKDLLKKYGYSHPPNTWLELSGMASKIQRGERKTDKNFYGFVFQGDAYEGLTCDALEWLASTGGGQFIQNGKVTINNPTAAGMLNLVRGWVGNIAPAGVTSYKEEDARNAFDGLHAAFMRNWPYAVAASKGTPVDGKFGVTVLPHASGHPAVGTVGGWQLAINKYSHNVGAATEFVRYLGSPAVQKFNALFASYVPVSAKVSADPAVRRAEPFLTPKINGVKRVTRPSRFLKGRYLAGSQIIFQGINQILNGQPANSILPGMESRLNRLLRG